MVLSILDNKFTRTHLIYLTLQCNAVNRLLQAFVVNVLKRSIGVKQSVYKL